MSHQGDTGDVIGFGVDTLHQTGRRIVGRAEDAGTTAKRLLTDLESAHTQVGDPGVGSAFRGFVTTHIADHAHHLGANVEASGDHVANVAATGRNSDEAGARGLRPATSRAEAAAVSLVARINLAPGEGSR